MTDKDLLRSLVTCSAELQIAHTKFRAVGREDVCQLLREAALKVGMAIHLHENGRAVEVVS